jgi:hypothetical protein
MPMTGRREAFIRVHDTPARPDHLHRYSDKPSAPFTSSCTWNMFAPLDAPLGRPAGQRAAPLRHPSSDCRQVGESGLASSRTRVITSSFDEGVPQVRQPGYGSLASANSPSAAVLVRHVLTQGPGALDHSPQAVDGHPSRLPAWATGGPRRHSDDSAAPDEAHHGLPPRAGQQRGRPGDVLDEDEPPRRPPRTQPLSGSRLVATHPTPRASSRKVRHHPVPP